MPFTVKRFESVGSTNSVLKELLTASTPEGMVVVAKEQTQGRGRLGRTWASPPGNLYCSLYLTPRGGPREFALLTYVISLAVALTCEHLLSADIPIRLKWPNDVLIDDGKVSGILLESLVLSETTQGLVVGMGINIAFAPTLPERKTSYLNAWGRYPLPISRVLGVLLRQIGETYMSWKRNGFCEIRKAWLARSYPLNQCLQIKNGTQLIEGAYKGIAEDGALLIQSASGTLHTLYAGEITL